MLTKQRLCKIKERFNKSRDWDEIDKICNELIAHAEESLEKLAHYEHDSHIFLGREFDEKLRKEYQHGYDKGILDGQDDYRRTMGEN